MVRASSTDGPSQGVPAPAPHLSASPRWGDVHAPPCRCQACGVQVVTHCMVSLRGWPIFPGLTYDVFGQF